MIPHTTFAGITMWNMCITLQILNGKNKNDDGGVDSRSVQQPATVDHIPHTTTTTITLFLNSCKKYYAITNRVYVKHTTSHIL